MITFLPYSDFDKIGTTLDYRRLGRQRVEALIILRQCLAHVNTHQPIVKMWLGHEYTLARYGHTMCFHWQRLGYKDNLSDEFAKILAEASVGSLPEWLYSPLLIRSHRSNLIRKKPEYYRRFWPVTPNNLPYYWPVRSKSYVVARSTSFESNEC